MNALFRALGTVTLLGTIALAGGCRNDGDSTRVDDDVRFRVMASSVSILAGEVVTLTTRSENTLGRDAGVKWTSTGGDIKTEDNGRIARVTFPNPGTYTVTGRLELDGQGTRTDSVDVRVREVR